MQRIDPADHESRPDYPSILLGQGEYARGYTPSPSWRGWCWALSLGLIMLGIIGLACWLGGAA